MSDWTIQVDEVTRVAALLAPDGTVVVEGAEQNKLQRIIDDLDAKDAEIDGLLGEKNAAYDAARTQWRVDAEADFRDFFLSREANVRDSRARGRPIV